VALVATPELALPGSRGMLGNSVSRRARSCRRASGSVTSLWRWPFEHTAAAGLAIAYYLVRFEAEARRREDEYTADARFASSRPALHRERLRTWEPSVRVGCPNVSSNYETTSDLPERRAEVTRAR
jgi:hypothetical protein